MLKLKPKFRKFVFLLIVATIIAICYGLYKIIYWVDHQTIGVIWDNGITFKTKHKVYRNWDIYRVAFPFAVTGYIAGSLLGIFVGEFFGMFAAKTDFREAKQQLEKEEKCLADLEEEMAKKSRFEESHLQNREATLNERWKVLANDRKELEKAHSHIRAKDRKMVAKVKQMEQKLKHAIEERTLAKKKAKALKLKLDSLQKQKRFFESVVT